MDNRIAVTFSFLLLAGCPSASQVLVGTPRAAIRADEVKIYSAPPPKFAEIAILNASSKSVFGTGGQRTIDKVIEQLKKQAAQLGANGLILEGFTASETASIGTGVGSDSYSPNSAVGVGVGGSFGVFKNSGQGRAIFVPPSQ